MARPVLIHTRPGAEETGLGLYEIEAGGVRGNKKTVWREGSTVLTLIFFFLLLPGPPACY